MAQRAGQAGKPRFKARHFTVQAFTIPEAVRMDGDRLHVPKVGWLRLAGSNLYAGCRPLTVRVRMEGTEHHPKWYAYICYEVPAGYRGPIIRHHTNGVNQEWHQDQVQTGRLRQESLLKFLS